MVHLLPYYQLDSFSTYHRNTRSKECLHPQHHLQIINVMEVNQACVDQETNKRHEWVMNKAKVHCIFRKQVEQSKNK